MEEILDFLCGGFECAQLKIEELDSKFARVEVSHESYLARAKNVIAQKLNNPKPKRFMTVLKDTNESEEEENMPGRADPELRPVRTAKTKASQNLKEIPSNVKMRNDNNSVSIKIERQSSTSSRESIKENKVPIETNQKRRSPDEGIQSGPESQRSSKRSDSVEIINTKVMEIDITDDEAGKMPPPALPVKKAVKKPRTKQKKQEVVEEIPVGVLRVTRSKIKQEKVSIEAVAQVPEAVPVAVVVAEPAILQPVSMSETEATKMNETTETKKTTKKKYPMPFLVKLEPETSTSKKASKSNSESNDQTKETSLPTVAAKVEVEAMNETYNVPAAVVVPSSDNNPNETVTLAKNAHDSMMTEDNDDESEGEAAALPPATLPKKALPPPVPPKLKKNEVFNPYMSSPVKQKIQAFEKHAVQGTPDRFHTLPAKYKSGTPSKIALFGKATPNPKMTSASSTSTLLTLSVPHTSKGPKPLKKMNSLSHESLEETKKSQQKALGNMLEEKRIAREEKQRQAQIQRDIIEKEKRDLISKQQQEREDKYRKIMKDKEEKQRMEALKKKMLKEKQAKKYAEEKAKKDDFVVPKPVEAMPSFNKDDSLHLKMQKQIMMEKAQQQKKANSKNVYSFEMLHTDDSTDDESRPSAKRPPPPEWSKKSKRKALIVMQSNISPCVLDAMFSVQPISVDLRAIFPAIDSKKLVRNSSAIWRTPPKHY